MFTRREKLEHEPCGGVRAIQGQSLGPRWECVQPSIGEPGHRRLYAVDTS